MIFHIVALLAAGSVPVVLWIFFGDMVKAAGRWTRDLAVDLRNGLRAAKRQRLYVEEVKRADARYVELRPKIHRVGEIVVGPGEGFGIEDGWELVFDKCSPHEAIVYPPVHEDLDGTKRIFGYTLAELQHFHARRAEFNVDA